MNHVKLRDKLIEATARIDVVIWIAGMLIEEYSASASVEEFLDNEDALRSCFPNAPDWLLQEVKIGDGIDAFLEWTSDKGQLGFLLKFCTPVMQHDDSGSSYSWSRYRSTWIYGDTLVKAVGAGLQWVKRVRLDEGSK
jgi:hypothetical protein